MKKIILALTLCLTSITSFAGEPQAQTGIYYTIVNQNIFPDGGLVDDVSILSIPAKGLYSVQIQTITTPVGPYCKAPICYPTITYYDIYDSKGLLVTSTFGTSPTVVSSAVAGQKMMYQNIQVTLLPGLYKVVIHGTLPKYPNSYFGKFGLQVLPI